MIRQTLIQSIKPVVRSPASAYRTISSTALRKAAGDTGAPRSGGSAQGDAFTKRENADESLWVIKKEREKLEALRAKIKEHQKHMEDLNKNIEKTMEENDRKMDK